jgi:CDP-diacylglycerol---glycerol-3-phosphate 3-phosphatidyltransferase
MHIQDLHVAVGLLIMAGSIVIAYLARIFLKGRARHSRTDADGGSVFVHKTVMEGAYWFLDPLIDTLAALRITPDMVTLFALVPALFAGIAAGFGWFALAGGLCMLGTFCDILDGLLARRLGVSSDAGEVIDAAVDRYSELLLLGGMTIYYRTHWMMMVLTLAALGGSFMFSYTTTKTEAMGVKPGRGSMRRAERAVYLITACVFTAVTRVVFAGMPSHALRESPIIFSLLLVAIVTNMQSVQRFSTLVETLRARRRAAARPEPSTDSIVEPFAAAPEPPGRPS